MTIEILNSGNQYVDITPWLAGNGISWKRGYVEGGNSMVMQDGTQFIDRIASKSDWSLAFKPMTAADQQTLLALLTPSIITMRVTDPEQGASVVATYYAGEVSSSYLVKRTGGTEWWGGMTVALTAR